VSCCPPKGYETLFGERAGRRDAKRYRRKGLDDAAERMVEFLRSRGIEGTTVLDIGGGVGAIDVELLKAGAGQAIDVEVSPYYESAARELWGEQGVVDRIEYRLANVAEDGKDVEPADVVVMHRVVCCYPDYDALVGAAAERTRRYLVMSFPREGAASRIVVRGINFVARTLRWEHRSYVHPIAEILAAAERRGLKPVFEHQGRIWRVAGLERA
jgi:2-polyprenyl-3-methyl-5-hydroxy-6-metoxy-1,4-benzoquinol methylase